MRQGIVAAFVLLYAKPSYKSTMKFVAALSLFLLSVATTLDTAAQAYQPLQGVTVRSVNRADATTAGTVDVGEFLDKEKALVVFGTYAADFNAIEYGQRLRYYWPKLQETKGIRKCALLLNCQPSAAVSLAKAVDLPESIELWVDNTGDVGRKFGVGRGWLPDDKELNPFLKLFGMLWGLGAWATLPAVIGGYIGNPFQGQPWIEDALAVGQRQGRWPDTALELSQTDPNTVVTNKFTELPLVGEWPRRPLELATLRLQSMLGISLAKWKELAPDDEALQAGVLTQLGGCLITDENGNALYEYRDPGICAVANFETIMKKI